MGNLLMELVFVCFFLGLGGCRQKKKRGIGVGARQLVETTVTGYCSVVVGSFFRAQNTEKQAAQAKTPKRSVHTPTRFPAAVGPQRGSRLAFSKREGATAARGGFGCSTTACFSFFLFGPPTTKRGRVVWASGVLCNVLSFNKYTAANCTSGIQRLSELALFTS
eukprot:TRINITY_DN968_c0_g1_i1.p1 TRINITY_DN968_c0_g1~~TRINITY_DN968_c0_g1_i1.p1  ORF type:complete len:164 (-),score=3.33 TRINITY_DN968_c0_g1_i1:270-761(-)